MSRFRLALLASLATLSLALPSSVAALPAFPGAQGFGSVATGGRGGEVLIVTTLAADGPGSLAEALASEGPRIIVFAVSGVIEADVLEIVHGDVTIAGQSAPGAGITIAGRLVAAYDYDVQNIVIRHIRVIPGPVVGPGDQYDAIQISRNSRVILDHVTVANGVDESVDLYEAQDVTVQWSAIAFAATEGHPEGEHNYGLINGPEGLRTSIHHNLFAHNKNRNPAIAKGPAEIRNNVAYDVRHAFVHHNPASGPFNIVGNHFKRGSSDDLIPLFFDDENGGSDPTLAYYLADNYVEDPGVFEGVFENPWMQPFVHPSFEYLGLDESHRSATEFDFSGESPFPDHVAVATDPVADAHDRVLACVGAFPRDIVTTRAVEDTLAGSGGWGGFHPADLLEGLTPETAPTDEDLDGMPDAWELEQGLDPSNADDHAFVMPSGYTAIEAWLNQRADELVGANCGGVGSGDGDGDTTGDGDGDTTGEGESSGGDSMGEGESSGGTTGEGSDSGASGGADEVGGEELGVDAGTGGSVSCSCSSERGGAGMGTSVLAVLGLLGLRRRRAPA